MMVLFLAGGSVAWCCLHTWRVGPCEMGGRGAEEKQAGSPTMAWSPGPAEKVRMKNGFGAWLSGSFTAASCRSGNAAGGRRGWGLLPPPLL